MACLCDVGFGFVVFGGGVARRQRNQMTEVPEGFPKLEKQTRPWNCPKADAACTRKKPCRSCLGRRNRRKGQRAQAQNRRALEDLTGTYASWRGKLANEETADHLPVRYENKAGKVANSVARAYLPSEEQSEAARAIGDTRPFVATFSPDGWSDGLVIIRTSLLMDFVTAAINAELSEQRVAAREAAAMAYE